jgi:hypothetical protein
MVDVEYLKIVLSYDAESGSLTWKERPPSLFSNGGKTAEHNSRAWNAKYAGKPAFSVPNGNGYLCGRISKRNFLAHRVVWAMHHGEWPHGELDHINGDRKDNRIDNLRKASRIGNARNVGIGSRNTSGYKGVSWNRDRGMWTAHVRVDGKSKYLGLFEDPELAKAAYDKAASATFGEFFRG